MKRTIKKIIKLEFYQDILIKLLRFFIQRNPLFVYFWIKCYLFEGVFRRDEENKKLFYGKYQSFNQKHPYLSAGSSFVLILAFVFSSVWWLVLRSPQPAAAWWDDTWRYRKPVELTNSTGADLTDHQVAVTVDTATLITDGKMQSSCQDMRFTDSVGNVLPYWVEENNPGCNNSATKVWVKVPTIYNGTDATTIYLYYGNSSASDAQDGSEVFLFFEDFVSPEYSWSSVGGNFSISSGVGTLSNSSNLCRVWAYPDATLNLSDYKLQTRYKYTGAAEEGGILARLSTSKTSGAIDGYEYSLRGRTSDDASIGEWLNVTTGCVGITNLSGSALDFTVTADTWYVNKLILNSSSHTWEPNESSSSTSVTATDSTYTSGDIGVWMWCGSSEAGSTVVYDYIFAYEYASTDPTAGTPGTEEQSQAPVGYWSFDEGYGTTAYNKNSNGVNGTLSNGPVWVDENECVSGKCLKFDGVNDYVGVGIGTDYLPTSTFSICTWIRSNGLAPGMTKSGIISITYGLIFELTGAGYFQTGMTDGSTNVYKSISENLYDDRWHHLCLTYDGTDRHMYIDGVKKLSEATTWTGTTNHPTNSVNIGHNNNNASVYKFYGFIDEPKIYSYSKTDDQIYQDYNAGLAGMGTSKGASVAVGGKSNQWMTDGLVGHWKMDESSWNGTSGEVLDASGNGNHGTAAGGATTASGKYGKAGSFDGSDDYVNVTQSDDLPSYDNTSYSFTAWVKGAANQTDKRVFSEASTSSNNPLLNIGTDLNGTSGKLRMFIRDDSHNEILDANSTGDVFDSTWHHIVWVDDNGDGKLYIDGVEDATDFSYTRGTLTLNTTTIGGILRATAGYHFAGSIDEIRIYNRALSPNEVTGLYEYAPGPVAHWKFDENTGTSAYDSTGNGYTGTLTNNATWASGKYGGGVEFDGDSDYVQMSGLMGTPTNATVTGWFKADGYDTGGGGGELFSVGDYIGVRINNNPNITCWYYNGSSWVGGTASGTDYADSQWHFFAFMFDSNTNSLKLYVDGNVVASNTYSGGISYSGLGSNTFIGKHGNSATTADFNGVIDDVRFYNYGRTAKQIIEDMNGGHPAGGSPVGSQLSYWKFDEGYGTTAYDSIASSGNDGTITGATWTNEGRFGKALSFDGTDDYVSISDSIADLSGDWAVAAWIKPYTDSNPRVFSLITASDNLVVGYMSSSLYPYIRLDDSSQVASTGLTSGEWQHIVYQVRSGTREIYLNGQSLTLGSGGITGNCTFSSIGGGNTGYFMNGSIDEVKIYNFALSEGDVLIDYNKGVSLKSGSKSTASDGTTASDAASREYCVPGDTSTCDSPIAEWKFDERTGTSVYDTSGNGNTGTLTNGPTWTQGKHGSGIDFDGTDDYVVVPDNDMLDFGDGEDMSISVWVYWNNGADTTETIVKKDLNYILRIADSSGSLKGIFWYGSSDAMTVDTDYDVQEDTWTHIVFTKSGSNYALYANGVALSTTNTPSVYGRSFTEDLTFGKSDSHTTEDFDGVIDDVRFYNYGRTAAQVAWEYNRGAPVGWWKMDEGSGLTVHDETNNGNDGTMTNMASDDWVDGKINGALDFDGTDDYVDLSDFTNYPYAVSCWIKENSSSNWSHYINNDGDSYENGQLIGGITSSKNCSELSWSVGYGSANVCGESDGSPLSGCSGLKTYLEAKTYCEGVGARLCTYEEMNNDETRGTGCSYDYENIWTSTFCGSGKHWTDEGRVGYGTGEECRDDSATAYVRCCADVVSPVSASSCLSKNSNLRVGELLTGKIDDMRFYNYALTAEQIKGVYNNGAVNYR